ncbi:hypothetical protein SAMN04487857_115123 [Pseudomonas sp. ok272]|uniref:hypothetical protein n=1 Tax=unclassified Pseudomonas TaxID=196821 RepID=UPI0008D182E7|nr:MULTISPECIES: hypothetical protein [unclassified Pseudomonas]SEN40338.1 hypothetical protein SAMN04487857_115123 [Pseudomonas sp. ok272]SFN24043.1 hypothetical protein SAMN04487858_115125 [Pseudomonas sp. ok602]
MSDTQQPTTDTTDATSEPYNEVNMSCGHCTSALKPTYQHVTDLIQQKPINCDQCHSDVLLEEADRQTLDNKLQRAARMGKVLMAIMVPYFLICMIVSVSIPAFSLILTGGGLALSYMIKTAMTDDVKHNFVLFKHGEHPATPDQTV